MTHFVQDDSPDSLCVFQATDSSMPSYVGSGKRITRDRQRNARTSRGLADYLASSRYRGPKSELQAGQGSAGPADGCCASDVLGTTVKS